MKIEWSRSSLVVLVFGCVLVLLLFLLGQRLWFSPIEAEINQREDAIMQEEKILAAIEANQGEEEREQILSSRTMQQQLPVIPLMDQMLIGLDRAENSSTSLIHSIAISDTESLLPIQETVEEDAENVDTETQADVQSMEETVQIIEGLHTLQFAVDITSENYEEMIEFLNELQSLPRVTQIESIQFETPDSERELGYSLLMNSYYQPLYADLANEAPQYHYGAASEKVTPFTMEQWEEDSPPGTVNTEEDKEELREEFVEGSEAEEGEGQNPETDVEKTEMNDQR